MKLFLLLLPILLTTGTGDAGTDQKISSALRTGNSKVLSSLFLSTVELSINGEEGTYARNDAEAILKAFFKLVSPDEFQIIHQGKAGSGVQYAIGNLNSEKGNYRVSYYLTTKESKSYIQQIIIDKE